MDKTHNKRKALSKKTRFDVFKRDAFECQYCGAHPPAIILHIDHIKPVADGGTNIIDNLVTACEPCNLGKGARLLSSVPATLAEKAKLIAEREAQLLGYQSILDGKRYRLETETWRVADRLIASCKTNRKLNEDWFLGIKRFIEKLGLHPVLEAADKSLARFSSYASERTLFLYFCGICWALVREEDAIHG